MNSPLPTCPGHSCLRYLPLTRSIRRSRARCLFGLARQVRIATGQSETRLSKHTKTKMVGSVQVKQYERVAYPWTRTLVRPRKERFLGQRETLGGQERRLGTWEVQGRCAGRRRRLRPKAFDGTPLARRPTGASQHVVRTQRAFRKDTLTGASAPGSGTVSVCVASCRCRRTSRRRTNGAADRDRRCWGCGR